jgi:hypothetical protein
MSLLDWDTANRIQFSIDTVVENVSIVPFVFRISLDTGVTNQSLTYIFDELDNGSGNSTANRKKLIFSQVVDGEELPLYCELDLWDHVSSIAIFWVKPLLLSPIYTNILYMYFDKNHLDNDEYLSETNATDVVRTPSQEIWSDDFFSVHHLNSSYGYIDSTENNLSIVSTTNTLAVPSNIDSSALELTNSNSYINFGTNGLYDYVGGNVGILLFSKLSSGNNILNKGFDANLSLSFYYLNNSFGIDVASSGDVINLSTEVMALNDEWTTYYVGREENAGANTTLNINNITELAVNTLSIDTNTSPLQVGSEQEGINGTFAEVWFSKNDLSRETISFINTSLQDLLLTVSKNHVKGYTTEYSKVVTTTVLVYKASDGMLVGIATSDPVTGYYYAEVATDQECFIVALGSELYNHFILGKIIPSTT